MSRKTVVYLVWSNTYVYSWYSIGIGKITQTASTQELYIKGSNYIWQDDSYDKIKNCGICINKGIDGYSLKKIAWSEVTYSSSFFHLALLQDILSLKEHKINMSQKVERGRGAENKDIWIQYCITK